MFFSKILPGNNKPQHLADVEEQKRTAIYRSLIRREAEIGGTLFGPVPKGGRREFFCLDETTWVWHEEWNGEDGQRKIRNTRYDMRPTGILKAQNGQGYQMISVEEAKHLQAAIKTYVARVRSEIYHTTA